MGCSSGVCGCSSGGCNKFNVYDWLSNVPPTREDVTPYVEVSFHKGSRKAYFLKNIDEAVEVGDKVTVEGNAIGFDVGIVTLTGHLVYRQIKKKNIALKELKLILRKANEKDIRSLEENNKKERNILTRARTLARVLKIEMKLSQVELQADGRKALFYYTADERIDFRELVKRYAEEFMLKIEMKQISARKEAGMIGGIGSCGRELCCSSWLENPKNVNSSAARYQNLSINTDKLNGQCGRLKCCLNYELEEYVKAAKQFPKSANKIITKEGVMKLIKKDILKQWMVYLLPSSNQYIALSTNQVKKLLDIKNKKISIEELRNYDLYKHQEAQKKETSIHSLV